MADTDQDVQEHEDNVDTSEDQVTDETADNEQDAGNESGNQEETDTGDSDEGDGSDTDTSDAAGSDSGSTEDEDDEEDEDDDSFFALAPDAGGAPAQGEQFDIRKLPRDPATGMINWDTANKAVNEFIQNRDAVKSKNDSWSNTVRTKLSTQWNKGKEKYPHVWKNPELRQMAITKHLSSLDAMEKGTGGYVSPSSALKQVDKFYKRTFTKGAQSQKIRKKVISHGTTERNTGTPTSKGSSDYDQARNLAMSKNPNEAKEGRMKLLTLRRQARRGA